MAQTKYKAQIIEKEIKQLTTNQNKRKTIIIIFTIFFMR